MNGAEVLKTARVAGVELRLDEDNLVLEFSLRIAFRPILILHRKAELGHLLGHEKPMAL
jgi:hypothetical protein